MPSWDTIADALQVLYHVVRCSIVRGATEGQCCGPKLMTSEDKPRLEAPKLELTGKP